MEAPYIGNPQDDEDEFGPVDLTGIEPDSLEGTFVARIGELEAQLDARIRREECAMRERDQAREKLATTNGLLDEVQKWRKTNCYIGANDQCGVNGRTLPPTDWPSLATILAKRKGGVS